MKNLLCKLGIHRPLFFDIKKTTFKDLVSKRLVFYATCPCGKKWNTEYGFKWFGKKSEISQKLSLRTNPFLIQSLINSGLVGRNKPCPCGSGKKFKKCCIKKGIS